MNDQKFAAELKRLNARITALEKLLQRIIRQRPGQKNSLSENSRIAA